MRKEKLPSAMCTGFKQRKRSRSPVQTRESFEAISQGLSPNELNTWIPLGDLRSSLCYSLPILAGQPNRSLEWKYRATLNLSEPERRVFQRQQKRERREQPSLSDGDCRKQPRLDSSYYMLAVKGCLRRRGALLSAIDSQGHAEASRRHELELTMELEHNI